MVEIMILQGTREPQVGITNNVPTRAEIEQAFGKAGTRREGFGAWLHDGRLVWICVVRNEQWHYHMHPLYLCPAQ